MTHNSIVDIVHVGLIHILLHHFLMDILVNIVLFEVGRFSVRLGMLGAGISGDCFHHWVVEGCRCLGHCVCLKYIPVG